MRSAVLVMGPAGSGKSTFCKNIISHCETIGRTIHLFNMDPAAENFEYEPAIDIRDLISLEDVMDELKLGPNGGLMYCFEYLMDNLDWLEDELGSFDDDYLLIDCPGQIELYTHLNIMPRFVKTLSRLDFRICGAYLLESQFVQDTNKFFAGVMSAMTAMINLEIPHINVLSKMDLVTDVGRKRLKRFLDPDPSLILKSQVERAANGGDEDELDGGWGRRFRDLNEAVVHLIDDFHMVSFLPLDITNEDSVSALLSHIDNAIQYGEDQEPKEPKETDVEIEE